MWIFAHRKTGWEVVSPQTVKKESASGEGESEVDASEEEVKTLTFYNV